MTTANVFCSDSLVKITDEGICFNAYYFPFGSKFVPFSGIDAVTTARPSLLNSRWRFHGSGDFRIWFPRDWHRPSRSVIFFAHLRGSSRQIGFTVENAEAVEQILRGKRLLPQ